MQIFTIIHLNHEHKDAMYYILTLLMFLQSILQIHRLTTAKKTQDLKPSARALQLSPCKDSPSSCNRGRTPLILAITIRKL